MAPQIKSLEDLHAVLKEQDFNPETVDPISQITDEIAGEYATLLANIYREPHLAYDRSILATLTKAKSAELSHVEDDHIRLILAIRSGLWNVYCEQPNLMPLLRETVSKMQDGDLAYSTMERIGTHGSITSMLGTADYHEILKQMRFSPETQSQIITSSDSGTQMCLASNHHLTPETQRDLVAKYPSFIAQNRSANAEIMIEALLAQPEEEKRDLYLATFVLRSDAITRRALKLVTSNPLAQIAYTAKTDPAAELEMISRVIAGSNFAQGVALVARYTPLHTSAAYTKLFSSGAAISLRKNPNSSKHSYENSFVS